jgi:hypothetical protein
MTDIRERRVVNCPNHKASKYMAAFVCRPSSRRRYGAHRVAAADLCGSAPLTERPVVATLSLESMNQLYPACAVSWLPKVDGPSPEFVGTLMVEKCRRDDCFGLILRGQYTPLGAATSVARGNRVARVPARGVLRTIADYVLDRCAHDEAALAGHSRYVSQ